MRNSKVKQKQLVQEYLARANNNNTTLPGNTYAAWFDGACEPINPGGNMGIGAGIKLNGNPIFELTDFVKAKQSNSNNVAEYMAFESILDKLQELIKAGHPIERITLYGDSKLVIMQQFGTWKMNGGYYVPYAKRCKDKLSLLRDGKLRINGIWIPRAQNAYADELSKRALINNNVEFRIQPLSIDPSK